MITILFGTCEYIFIPTGSKRKAMQTSYLFEGSWDIFLMREKCLYPNYKNKYCLTGGIIEGCYPKGENQLIDDRWSSMIIKKNIGTRVINTEQHFI